RAGNIVEKRDGKGRTLVTWEIGPRNLEQARIQASGERHSFQHDERGRITAAQTPAGTSTFSYAADGRLIGDQRDGKGITHAFDLGRLVKTTCFGRFVVSFETDDNGDLTIQDPTGAKHGFKLSESGLIARLFANGDKELCHFDDSGRCLRKVMVRRG